MPKTPTKKRKPDTRIGGIPKLNPGKPGPNYQDQRAIRRKEVGSKIAEQTQSEYTNRRREWRKLPASVRRNMILYEDYTWEPKKPKKK